MRVHEFGREINSALMERKIHCGVGGGRGLFKVKLKLGFILVE